MPMIANDYGNPLVKRLKESGDPRKFTGNERSFVIRL